MADYIINIYKTGTTDQVGSGVLDGNWFISVKDSAGAEIGNVVANEFIIDDSVITINSTAFTDLVAEQGLNVVVKNQDGNLVGSLVAGEWIVNTAGGGGSGTAVINDSTGTELYSLTVPDGSTVVQAISDSSVVLKQSDGTTTIRTVSVVAQGTVDETIGLATVNVNKSDAVLIEARTVEAEDTATVTVPDSPITINTVAMDNIKATDTGAFEVVDEADGTTLVGSKLSNTKWQVTVGGSGTPNSSFIFKTGDVTQQNTGDDGGLERGRGADFFTLDVNNAFGNTSRFTDTLGGQVYANDWVIDHSATNAVDSIMAYYRVPQAIITSLANHMNIQPLTLGGFSDVYICNINEIFNIYNKEHTILPFNYAPFNYVNTNGTIGTTTSQLSDNYFWFASNGNMTRVAATTSAQDLIMMRFFSYAELGL